MEETSLTVRVINDHVVMCHTKNRIFMDLEATRELAKALSEAMSIIAAEEDYQTSLN